ncbi:IFRD1 family protein [Megaselia abdita]
MPKKNKKLSKRRDNDSDDVDSMYEGGDNNSVYSVQSDGASNCDADELSAMEKYEDKITIALENATEKSAQTRSAALQEICQILSQRYMPYFLEDRKVTIVDCIEKSIRRGKGAEQIYGSRLAPLLVLQLGGDESISNTLNQFLLTTAQDKTTTCDVRASCCLSLGLLNFLGGEDIGKLVNLMQHFENIFSESYLKGDDKTPISVTAEAAALHAEALSAWGLLLTLIPPGDFVSFVNNGRPIIPSFKKIFGLLKSVHLDVRMSAGEIIALILESGRSYNEDFLDDYLDELIEAVKSLATDSHKYRAKRDRKTQRAIFREVLRYLEEDISPEVSIKFGSESLILNTWALHHQYTCMCTMTGPGMTLHLQENDFLRTIFELGSKPVYDSTIVNQKQSKLEKHLVNAAAFKARTISRGKNRDKRSAVIN